MPCIPRYEGLDLCISDELGMAAAVGETGDMITKEVLQLVHHGMANLTMQIFDPEVAHKPGTCPHPFNSTPMAANSFLFGSPHVRCTPMGVHRTRGDPSEIKKIPTRKMLPLFFASRPGLHDGNAGDDDA